MNRSRISAAARGYAAGLILAAPFVPAVAAVAAIAAYLLLPVPREGLPALGVPSLALGLAATAVAWLLLAGFLRSIAGAEHALPRVYRELEGRHDALRDRLAALPRSAAASGAYQQVVDILAQTDFELNGEGKGPAVKWALGYGYTNVLRELHRAAELLILIDSTEEVVAEGINDELALEGSTIDNRERLRSILRAAIGHISPAAARMFLPPDPGTNTMTDIISDSVAREAAREVDHAISDFRDRTREELVRSRNNLMWAMLALAATAYSLLGLAFIRGVSRDEIAAASAFFLVGAVIGLFHRVNIDAGRDSAVEDYGLYQARLIAAPVLSGIAAVGGVYLIAAAPGLTIAAGSQPALSAIFSLTETSHIGLVYAAIFGLTPGALTGRLERQTRKLEEDLASSATATPSAA